MLCRKIGFRDVHYCTFFEMSFCDVYYRSYYNNVDTKHYYVMCRKIVFYFVMSINKIKLCDVQNNNFFHFVMSIIKT